MTKTWHGVLFWHHLHLVSSRPALFYPRSARRRPVPASWSLSKSSDGGFPSKEGKMTCEEEKMSAPWFCAGNANGGVVASHPLIKQQPSSCSDGSSLSQRPFAPVPQRAEDATLGLVLKDRADRNFARGRWTEAGGKVISNSLFSFSYYSFLIRIFFPTPSRLKHHLCGKTKVLSFQQVSVNFWLFSIPLSNGLSASFQLGEFHESVQKTICSKDSFLNCSFPTGNVSFKNLDKSFCQSSLLC